MTLRNVLVVRGEGEGRSGAGEVLLKKVGLGYCGEDKFT